MARDVSPHPLFDVAWYRSQRGARPDPARGLLHEYVSRGARADLSPHPAFDSAHYLQQRPELLERNINPLGHFVSCGANDGARPNPYFDPRWYSRFLRDSDDPGANPLVHFLLVGAAGGLNPHPNVDLARFRASARDCPPDPVQAFLHLVRTVRVEDYFRVGTMSGEVFGATSHHDIDGALCDKGIKGLALIFFMGLGDYLMATPLVETLRRRYPGLRIHGHASTTLDSTNSPLVASVMRANPCFDAVFTYAGRKSDFWMDYDYSDARSDIPDDFLTLPVTYDTAVEIPHRAVALSVAFGQPVELPVPTPRLYPAPLTQAGAALRDRIVAFVAARRPQRLVVAHFDTRSSNYLYPHIAEVVQRLGALGCAVLSLTPSGDACPDAMDIDVTKIAPTDTIEILRELRAGPIPVAMVAVNSVMWAVAAGLDIPNLGLHILYDPVGHQYQYPNTYVVTPYAYPMTSPHHRFLTTAGQYRERESDLAGTLLTLLDYEPDYVVDCFEQMIAIREGVARRPRHEPAVRPPPRHPSRAVPTDAPPPPSRPQSLLRRLRDKLRGNR